MNNEIFREAYNIIFNKIIQHTNSIKKNILYITYIIIMIWSLETILKFPYK